MLVAGLGHVYAGAPARGGLAWVASRVAATALLAVAVAVPGRVGLAILVAGTIAVALVLAADAARVARRAPSDYPLRRYNRRIVYAVLAGIGVGLQIPWHMAMSAYVAHKVRVLTDAMAPTLLAGDRVYAAPLGETPPARGSNVVYRLWGTTYIKRVAGLPNDTLTMRGGALWVNARPVQEPYAVHSGEREIPDRLFTWQRAYLVSPVDRGLAGALPPAAQGAPYTPTLATWGPLVVPPHSYFLLGDNRGESMDSRYRGFLPDTAILAHPVTIYFSRDRATGRVRWSRIGQTIR